jgi:enhancer of polycomb-like protein
MPSGMEKEEEAEKHLQDILESQEHSVSLVHHKQQHKRQASPQKATSLLSIPIPEVYVAKVEAICSELYKHSYKPPRQYIHVQPFAVDRDLPDYDLDDEDVEFLDKKLNEEKRFEVVAVTLEDMLDRLEKNSGHSVVSAKEAKMLLKEDDDLILAVYDYWVDKRLRLRQPLIPAVKTDKREMAVPATPSSAVPVTNNPYMAFRRRTEKMQTRKNRKNDEASYEKMLKLRRDLSRAVTLLELVRRREKTKKENLLLTSDIFERRFMSADWDGKIIAEALAQRQQPQRVLQPAFMNMEMVQQLVQEGVRQKRSYTKKKRKANQRESIAHMSAAGGGGRNRYHGPELGTGFSSDDESTPTVASPDAELEDNVDGPFYFRRKRNCQYLAPLLDEHRGWPWEPPEEGGAGEAKYRYSLASLSTPNPKCLGMVRRRVGRGGRIVLDRVPTDLDDLWRSMDLTVYSGMRRASNEDAENLMDDWPHYRPATPPHWGEESDSICKIKLSETVVGLPTQPIKQPVAAALHAARGAGIKPNSAMGLTLMY